MTEPREFSDEQEALLSALDRKDAKGVFRLPAFGFPRRKVEVHWLEPIGGHDLEALRRTVEHEKAAGANTILSRVHAARLATREKRVWEDFRIPTVESLERRGVLVVKRERGEFFRK